MFSINGEKKFVNTYVMQKGKEILEHQENAYLFEDILIRKTAALILLAEIAECWTHYEIRTRLREVIRRKHLYDMKKTEYEHKAIGIPRTTYGRFTAFDQDLLNRNDRIDSSYLDKIKDYLFKNDLELKEPRTYYFPRVDILEIEKLITSEGKSGYVIPERTIEELLKEQHA